MREATGEWVLQEVEHAEELSRWHEHVVAEEAGDDLDILSVEVSTANISGIGRRTE